MSDTATESTNIVPSVVDPSEKTLDGLLTRVALEKTMGDIVKSFEKASLNARAFTVARMYYNAVFELDVEMIKTIVTRIDGLVPAEGERGAYANILGDALDDVLDMPTKDAMMVEPSDPPIIAMAKVLVLIATAPAGKNPARRKERNLAAQMVLERTGGRKVEPTKLQLDTEYVEPEWMRLPEGGEDEQGADRGGVV